MGGKERKSWVSSTVVCFTISRDNRVKGPSVDGKEKGTENWVLGNTCNALAAQVTWEERPER